MDPDASHVGRRATVRVRVRGTGPSGGPAMTDVVGEVVSITEDEIRVRRRSGEVATIARGAIMVFHLIPSTRSAERDVRHRF